MNQAPDQLYIWLNGDSQADPADVTIDDVPGISDLDLIAQAIANGRLGRYLPVGIQFTDRAEPPPNRVRSVDVARLLRSHNIRHRRRYEVFPDGDAEPGAGM